MASVKIQSLKFIFFVGLFAGALDISVALADYAITSKNNPLVILKYIASAVFGSSALSGGITMIFAGFFFHFVIALLFTFFFFVVYANTNLLSKNKWITAVLYAIFIWLVVNNLVIPLSNAPYLQIPFAAVNKVIKAITILIFTMGLPLSFLAHRYYKKHQNTGQKDAPLHFQR